MIEEKLKQWALRMRIDATMDEIKSYCKDFDPIRTDPNHKAYITHEISQLARIFYGKEIDKEDGLTLTAEIKRRFSSCSCIDIHLAFTRIKENRTQCSKFFNISEITREIHSVQSEKNRIRQRFFELKNEHERSEQDAVNWQLFIHKCIQKKKTGQTLNVYEKSALGRNFEDSISEAPDLLEKAERELSDMNKALRKIQDDRMEQVNRAVLQNEQAGRMNATAEKMGHTNKANRVFVGAFSVFGDLDEQPDEPLYWTKELVYGNLLYDYVKF